MLFNAGATTRLGSVEDGNTVSDYREEEIEHRISMNLTPLHCEWNDHNLHVLDTPGYSDFTSEVHCAMRVTDNVAVVVKAIEGIEVETERAWEYAEQYGLPRMVVINQLDKEHADFYDALGRIQERFGTQAVPVQIPIGEGDGFSGVVDLVAMEAVTFAGGGGKGTRSAIPDEVSGQADEYREKLVGNGGGIRRRTARGLLRRRRAHRRAAPGGASQGRAGRRHLPRPGDLRLGKRRGLRRDGRGGRVHGLSGGPPAGDGHPLGRRRGSRARPGPVRPPGRPGIQDGLRGPHRGTHLFPGVLRRDQARRRRVQLVQEHVGTVRADIPDERPRTA